MLINYCATLYLGLIIDHMKNKSKSRRTIFVTSRKMIFQTTWVYHCQESKFYYIHNVLCLAQIMSFFKQIPHCAAIYTKLLTKSNKCNQ